MRALIRPGLFSRTLRLPASKSHTIRRLLLASLTAGISNIAYPLDSLDARSCLKVCRTLWADIDEDRDAGSDEGGRLRSWTVQGRGFTPPREALDVGNSGTTLFLALAAAALGTAPVTFTGDEQISRRGAGPLLDALATLGADIHAAENGCVPITVRGPWKGGRVSIACPTSQYLSALLLAAPLAPAGVVTEIDVPLLNEKPYIEMTLSYLNAQGVPYEGTADFSRFVIPGGAAYRPVNGPVPGDFSSAAFPAAAAAITGGPVQILGLDPADPQGDKAFMDMLEQMGCRINWSRIPSAGPLPEWTLRVERGGPLLGGVFDLNATPDLLPVMAVTAAYASGDTALVNVAHARIKETDRIVVMAGELGKLGIAVNERPDGLVIHGRGNKALSGGCTDSRGDHRIAMALGVGALGAAGPIEIERAESAAVTYPGFLELLKADIINN